MSVKRKTPVWRRLPWIVCLALVVVVAGGRGDTGAATVRVTGQRTIAVPDGRVLTMSPDG